MSELLYISKRRTLINLELVKSGQAPSLSRNQNLVLRLAVLAWHSAPQAPT